MNERYAAARLPPWAESLLTPEQRRTVLRRFGSPEIGDPHATASIRFTDPGDGQGGGGTPAPTSPSAPASLTRRVGTDDPG